MSLLNLWKTVNAQQESVNKNVELLQQNISYLQKELTSKNETIKSLLEIQFALIESINKPTANGSKYPVPQWNLNQTSHYQLLTFKTNLNQNTHQSFRFWQHLKTNLKIEQDEKNNEQSSD